MCHAGVAISWAARAGDCSVCRVAGDAEYVLRDLLIKSPNYHYEHCNARGTQLGDASAAHTAKIRLLSHVAGREEEQRSLITDLKRHARIAVAWSRHGSLVPRLT